MRREHDIGGAAKLGRLGVAQLEIHVLRHRRRAGPGCVAGAEIAVDIGAREARVGECAERHLGVQLRHRLVRRMARRMLEGAGDVGFALDGHA